MRTLLGCALSGGIAALIVGVDLPGLIVGLLVGAVYNAGYFIGYDGTGR